MTRALKRHRVGIGGVNRNLVIRNFDFAQCPIRTFVGQMHRALDKIEQSLAALQRFHKAIVYGIS